jgi:asparagine synthase (glutamine-hydrolysing)
MCAAFAQWGVERALERFTGMFAFALWDAGSRRLWLARDRFGEKPLYYGWSAGRFLFGSELKAFEADPEFGRQVDRGALALLLRYNCVPAPFSIYKGVRKLPPGTSLELAVGPGAPAPGEWPRPRPYWSAAAVAVRGAAEPSKLTDEEATAEVERVLGEAVGRQLVSDVPLGAFLSGGIDSSTVVALMQARSARRVRTFTIGFREKGYDEAAAARAVAGHLGTEHTELYVSPADALALVPGLAAIYDEPFADSSQLPTALVARLARAHVTVTLSGDGGDELFGGYNRHVWAPRLWSVLGRTPPDLRRLLGAAGSWLKLEQAAGMAAGPLADKVRKALETVRANSLEELYLGLRTHWPVPDAVVLGLEREPDSLPVRPPAWPHAGPLAMACVDALTYLPDDILVKVDRAAMAVGLESRVPFLDPRVAELAWSLRPDQRIRAGQGKWILRQVLSRHLPRELFERPKTGFAAPIGAWLRGELREWAETLLDERRLRLEGFFDPVPVRVRWHEHLRGGSDHAHALWDVLMFQAWLERARASSA